MSGIIYYQYCVSLGTNLVEEVWGKNAGFFKLYYLMVLKLCERITWIKILQINKEWSEL